jgi:SnoaL-like domain
LRDCFHPDATITVAWYAGPASGFIERSIAMAQHRRPEEHHKHWLGNMRANVVGARAVLESDAMVLIREYIDEYLFDYCCHLRFYDLLGKRDGVWRLWKASCIYEKDRLDPVIPGAVPVSFFAAIDLSGSDAGFAYMRFRQQKKGRACRRTSSSSDRRRSGSCGRRRAGGWLSLILCRDQLGIACTLSDN